MGQEAVDTRALEVATEALTRVDSHEKHCSERYKTIVIQHQEVSEGQKAIFNKLDRFQRSQFLLWLTVAGGVIGILISIILYLLTHEAIRI